MSTVRPTTPKAAGSSGPFQLSTLFSLFAMLFCLVLPSPVTMVSSGYLTTASSSARRSTIATGFSTGAITSEESHGPLCPHVVLLSAARHGSTWFIDSVERCRFSEANNGTSFGKLNMFSEMWMTSHDGPLRDMKYGHALDYVTTFMSIKFFPWTWTLYSENITSLVRAAHHMRHLPVVVLTRSHADAYRSFVSAQEKGTWNSAVPDSDAGAGKVSTNEVTLRQSSARAVNVKQNASVRQGQTEQKKIEEDEDFKHFAEQRDEYFKTIRSMLKQNNVKYDQVDYDEIKGIKWIHLPNSQCYVRNCNDWATR